MILEVNGKTIEDSRQLRMTISMMNPDATVKLKLLRNGNPTSVSVKLGESAHRQGTGQGRRRNIRTGVGRSDRGKSRLANHQRIGIARSHHGSRGYGRQPFEPARIRGIARGDVIQEVNHQPVKTVAQLEEAVRKAGKNPLLLVNRKGSTIFMAE